MAIEAPRIESLIIGTMSRSAIEAEYGKRDIGISPWTQYLIERTLFSEEARELRLVWQSGGDLGLTGSFPYRAFVEAGQAKGFTKLGSEVALYLRRQDNRQPLGDSYGMAMEPIVNPRDGSAGVFALAHDAEGLWLDAAWPSSSTLWRWHPEDRLVFGLSN